LTDGWGENDKIFKSRERRAKKIGPRPFWPFDYLKKNDVLPTVLSTELRGQ